jgi:hypothetical protein
VPTFRSLRSVSATLFGELRKAMGTGKFIDSSTASRSEVPEREPRGLWYRDFRSAVPVARFQHSPPFSAAAFANAGINGAARINIYGSAANLKSLSMPPRLRHRNFKFKAARQMIFASAPLIPRFTSGTAVMVCEPRNRSSSAHDFPKFAGKRALRRCTNFGKWALD